jgi:hypothetical protein
VTAASLRGCEPGSKETSTLEDTADGEYLVLCVVNWIGCEFAISLQLLVVLICKYSANPITNPKPGV